MKIHWWHVYGRYTCHKNEPGLTYVESFVGEIGEDDYGWYIRVSGSEVGEDRWTNQERARKALLIAVGGEPVNEWD